MSVCIEVTCRDVEVSREMRHLVLAHADALRDYENVVELCHVIIRHRGAAVASHHGYSAAIDLVLRDGRTFEACLRDRHVYFESLEGAVDEAFRELQCWLHDMTPIWRREPGEYVPSGCMLGVDPIDRPEDSTPPGVMTTSLRGTHYFVG